MTQEFARFDRDRLHDALQALGRLANAEGKTIEISVYGGFALVLTFDWRQPTRDVDAVFEADKATVRRLVATVAEMQQLSADWMNDGVKGFLSERDGEPESKRLFRTFPSEEEPGLRVMVAAPEYMFAMKCRAMRLVGSDEPSDVEDIRHLAAELGISDVNAALDLIAQYYPSRLLEPKVRFGLMELLG